MRGVPARLEALRVAPLAAARLARLPRGRVLAVFGRTVNVELDGTRGRSASWVSLHGPGPVPSPFGITCAGWSRLRVRPGAPVRVAWRDGGVGRLDVGEAGVELARAVLADTRVARAAPSPDVERLLDAATQGAAGAGLAPIVAQVLGARVDGVSAGCAPPSALALAAGPAVAALGAATGSADPAACLAPAARLLGLGPGLTPSGDDLLVGWIAGLRSAGEARWLAAVARPLEALARAATTPLSRAILGAALAGHLAEPACAFVCRPDAARLAALLALGATSGADFFAGYCLARRALDGRRAAA